MSDDFESGDMVEVIQILDDDPGHQKLLGMIGEVEKAIFNGGSLWVWVKFKDVKKPIIFESQELRRVM